MKLRNCLLLSMLALLMPLHAASHDRVVHYDVVYAIALANNFSPEDASIMAAASEALDDNQSTTAFDFELLGKESMELGQGKTTPSEFEHMKSGQVFHALTEQRELIEQAHIDRINRCLDDKNTSRARQLVYFGQYMHFVADSVVHPDNSLIGHFLEGHIPDRSDIDYDNLRITAALLSNKMGSFKRDIDSDTRTVTVTTPNQYEYSSKPIVADSHANDMLENVLVQVNESWARSYPSRAGWLLDLYTAERDEARQARATSEIARVLKNRGYEYTFYRPFTSVGQARNVSEAGYVLGAMPGPAPKPLDRLELSSDGEPIASGKWQDFGPLAEGQGAFAADLAAIPELKQEREKTTATEAIRAAGNAALDATTGWIVQRDRQSDDERMAAAWLPPSSPGGIALNPNLKLAFDEIGEPLEISLRGRSLSLRTSKGNYVFDGVSPQSFATLARAISAGQSPYLSIGSEPSNQPGYARVSLSPLLRNTAEGRALYQADLQFKTIFARLPLEAEVQARGLENLITGYPGNGGDFVRFWITSSEVRMELKGGRLVTVDSGMRINSETRIGPYARRDPEMEVYAANLTRHWDEIATALPEFRQVQSLALATAIVFWARDNRVAIDPMLFLIPSDYAPTPEFTRVVASYDGRIGVAGGVSLAPEDRGTELGRGFLSNIGFRLGFSEATRGYALARWLLAADGLLVIFAAFFLPTIALWLLFRRWSPVRLSFAVASMIWLGTLVANFVAIAVLSPLTLGDTLSVFDRDFLRIASTFVLFPALLFVLLNRRLGDTPLTPRLRKATLVLGLCGPIALGFAGLGLAHLTVATTGPVPTLVLNRVLTTELAPLETAFGGIATHLVASDGSSLTVPVPESLFRSAGSDFSSYRSSSPGGEVLELEGKDVNLPAQTLYRVSWPDDRQAVTDGISHYTIDGEPPF